MFRCLILLTSILSTLNLLLMLEHIAITENIYPHISTGKRRHISIKRQLKPN